MLNIRVDESQGGIKIARRNINNLRYADNTTLMAKSEEETKEPSFNMLSQNTYCTFRLPNQ